MSDIGQTSSPIDQAVVGPWIAAPQAQLSCTTCWPRPSTQVRCGPPPTAVDDPTESDINAAKIASSVFFNYVGTIAVAFTGFIATPILIHALGQGQFGAWALMASIIGYSSLLDLGVGLTVMRMVAERVHLSDRAEVRAIASTGLVIYGLAGSVLLVAGLVAAPILATAFDLHGTSTGDFTAALMILFASVGLTFPAGLYTGINQAFGHFRQQNTIVVLQALLGTVAGIVTVLLGGGIVELALAQLCVALAGFATKIVYAHRAFAISPHLRHFDRSVARMVVGVSTWMFLINIAAKVVWDTDAIVVGATLGTIAVSHYAVALGPATAIRRFTDQFNSVSLSAASSLRAQGEMEALRRLLSEATRIVTIFIGPILVCLALWGHQFLALWVGPKFQSSLTTLLILVIGIFASSIQATASQVLVALERHRIMAFVSIAEAVANLSLSIVLAFQMGIAGVALGTTIPTSIVAFGFYIPYAARLVELPVLRLVRRLLLPISICGIAYAGLWVLAGEVHFGSLVEFLAATGVVTATCIAASIILDREERMTYLGIASGLRDRVRGAAS